MQVTAERVRGALAGTLSDVLERSRAATGADIVALYPYDHETDSFYGAIAIGLPEGDPVRALPDLNDQLRRFREDEAQGKIPDDFAPTTYGASSWLLAKRTPLVSPDPGQHRARDVQRLAVQRAISVMPAIYPFTYARLSATHPSRTLVTSTPRTC